MIWPAVVLPVNVVVLVTANVPILPMPTVVTLPAVTLPLALKLVPVITPPTTLAPVTVPLALNVVVTMLPVNAVVTFQAVVDEL